MSNKRNERRGATVLLEVLGSDGARYVFGNPAATELPLIDALVDAPDTRYVLALQEASAVAMADGYAEAASRPGVLNLHTAGGLGHGLGNPAALPYRPEYGLLSHVPASAIRGPGYTFVPGVGILGESCNLPTSACSNEYRDIQ